MQSEKCRTIDEVAHHLLDRDLPRHDETLSTLAADRHRGIEPSGRHRIEDECSDELTCPGSSVIRQERFLPRLAERGEGWAAPERAGTRFR